jgi:hypothetical protein
MGNIGKAWRCFESKAPHDHRQVELAQKAAKKFAAVQATLGVRCRIECLGKVLVEGEPVHPFLHLSKRSPVAAAAPTYFPPEVIQVAPHEFVFVDGGVTMYNDPAFQLFLMVTTEPYRLCWPTGEEKMLLVSVGTGASANANLSPEEMNLLYNAGTIPGALMSVALHEQDFLCRIFGNCVAGEALDDEVGTVIGQGIPGVPKLFTYARYNAELDKGGHDGTLASELRGIQPAHVQQMDSVEHIDKMQRVGEAVGKVKVMADHFTAFSI